MEEEVAEGLLTTSWKRRWLRACCASFVVVIINNVEESMRQLSRLYRGYLGSIPALIPALVLGPDGCTARVS